MDLILSVICIAGAVICMYLGVKFFQLHSSIDRAHFVAKQQLQQFEEINAQLDEAGENLQALESTIEATHQAATKLNGMIDKYAFKK